MGVIGELGGGGRSGDERASDQPAIVAEAWHGARLRRLVGRDVQLQAMDVDWRAACSGTPRLVLVEGAEGVGKTALTDEFIRRVSSDATVLRASGEESETPLQFGVAREALRAAARATHGTAATWQVAPAQTAAAGERLLAALSELEQRTPVLLTIDDLHWADASSLGVVLYMLRRLDRARVMIVLVLRDKSDLRIPAGIQRFAGGSAGRTIRLESLDEAQLTEFAASFGADLSAYAARRLWQLTQGNPLYARALLEELPASAWLEHGGVAVPRSYAALIARRLDGCSPAARRLVEAAAVLGSGHALAAVGHVAELQELLGPAGEACAADLLVGGGDEGDAVVVFSHPMVRASVQARIEPLRRAALHLRAAAAVAEPIVGLYHRAAAASGPDEAIAAELEHCARDEASRGWWASAGEHFRLASALSPGRTQRETRMLHALDAMISAGYIERARSLASMLDRFEDTALRDFVLGNLALLSAHPHDAEPLLNRAWERCDSAVQPDLAATIATRHAIHWHLRVDEEQACLWAERALGIAGACRAVTGEARVLRAIALRRLGRVAEAREALSGAVEMAGDLGTALRAQMGSLRMMEDDMDTALADLRQAGPAALACGMLNLAAVAYTLLARTQFLTGEWDEAMLHAERAVKIVTSSEHPLPPFVWVEPIQIQAARGEWEAADQYLAMAHEDPLRCADRTLNLALATAIASAGRRSPAAVIEALHPFLIYERRSIVEEPGVWQWPHLYAQALVGAERLADAEAFLSHHEALAEMRGTHSTLARLARVRGQLEAARGEEGRAERAFESALDHVMRVRLPYEQALIELEYGTMLRTQGRRRAAEDRLQASRLVFMRLGARPMLERCDRDLQALGISTDPSVPRSTPALTAAERRVAVQVASGMSNREVASELSITTKAVEFHLTRVYAKLGLRSRGQLIAKVVGSGGIDLLAEPTRLPDVAQMGSERRESRGERPGVPAVE